MPELSNYTTLRGSIRVFDGSLSKTQFEEIWDRVEERLNSDVVPEFSVVDSELDPMSSNPVENRAIVASLNRVYGIFPARYISGTPYEYSHIYDGGDAPLAKLRIDFGPNPVDIDGVNTFSQISSLPSVIHHLPDGAFIDETSDGGTVVSDYDTEVYRLSVSEADSNGLYAGSIEIDSKKRRLYYCRYYSSYSGETLIGPWVSSMDEYSESGTPTIGAEVIDLGSFEKYVDLTDNIGATMEQLSTVVGENEYMVGDADNENESVCRSWGITYRCDPNLYVIQATGLTASQRQALIDLLDD